VLDPEDRVLIVGTSSTPYATEKPKDAQAFKDFFPKILRAASTASAAMGACASSSPMIAELTPPSAMSVSGKRRALLVGINYNNTSAQLRGCINDIKNQKEVLLSHYGFQEHEIRMLSEDEPHHLWPKKQHIVEGLRWLFEGASSGDLLFFQYSGHGSQFQTPRGLADCICPLDCIGEPWPGSVILDTEIHTLFYDPLPMGCKAIALFDCCHSGTVANLPVYRHVKPNYKPKARFLKPPAEISAPTTPEPRGGIRSGVTSSKYDQHQLWVFSGCQDNQTSADAYCDGSFQGAFTWAMIKALKSKVWTDSYIDVLGQVKHNLKGYTQIPALTTSTPRYLDYWYMGRSHPPASKTVQDLDSNPPANIKRALLVGVNYVGKACELQGSINDVKKQKVALTEHFGFPESEVRVLTEEEEGADRQPNKAAIMEGLEWLMDGVKSGDWLFFHFSGHGSKMTDKTGTAPDGMNECLCPLDCTGSWPEHVILDTEFHSQVYDRLPEGVKLVCVFDCSHSPPEVDVPKQPEEEVEVAERPAHRYLSPPPAVAGALPKPKASIFGECLSTGPPEIKEGGGFSHIVSTKQEYRDQEIWVYSACQEAQSSADIALPKTSPPQYHGAFTWALLSALEKKAQPMKHTALLRTARAILLEQGHWQMPALSTTNVEFFDRYFLGKR